MKKITAIGAFAGLGLAALFTVTNGASRAAEITLRYAHFMPASSWQNKTLFNDWAAAIEKGSNGRIDVQVYPAQTLGKAPAGYDNARNGVAEIAWTVQGYTANRFPLSQIIELPRLFKTAAEGSCAFQKLYDSGVLDGEYNDTHVLFVHVHSPGTLHTKGRPVKSLKDIRGLKIRRPTAVIGKLLTELGALPVGMPAPRIYEAARRGVIDGFMLPWEAVKGFRAYEVADQHTELGLYSLAFVATMNKLAYGRLPDDLKALIKRESGMKWAMIAGRGYDNGESSGKEISLKSGTLNQINPAEKAEWLAAGERVTQSYLAELEARGLPARKTYAAIKRYVSECRKSIGQQ